MLEKHNLRSSRNAAHLTQKQLSNSSGVSASTISHIECHRGPNVPKSELRPTKTKLSTALRLTVALEGVAAGDYSIDDFIAQQTIFTKLEIYEAVRTGYLRTARKPKRKPKATRHLEAVS